jgi:predicted nuclease of predicted toxin-antitoxin system
MRLLANENFPPKSVAILIAAGFDVKVVGVEFAGITDREVMEIAVREERTILTFDRHRTPIPNRGDEHAADRSDAR